jgi:hypothetical protein
MATAGIYNVPIPRPGQCSKEKLTTGEIGLLFMNFFDGRILTPPVECGTQIDVPPEIRYITPAQQIKHIRNNKQLNQPDDNFWKITFLLSSNPQSVKIEFIPPINAKLQNILSEIKIIDSEYFSKISNNGLTSVNQLDNGDIEYHAIIKEINFEAYIFFSADLSEVKSPEIDIATQINDEVSNNMVIIQDSMNVALNNIRNNNNRNNNNNNNNNNSNDKCPVVQIAIQTDLWGCDLGEMICNVIGNKIYPGGYPRDLVGKCEGLPLPPNPNPISGTFQTIFSAKPDLSIVLKLSGKTLLEQITLINQKYHADPSDCNFFGKILIYSTLKYFFSGLLYGIFDVKWLLRKYNRKFLSLMANSEFSCFLILFTDPQFGLVGLDKYFLCDFPITNNIFSNSLI